MTATGSPTNVASISSLPGMLQAVENALLDDRDHRGMQMIDDDHANLFV
ncbi:MAG: hypothetical protein N2C12_15240 [Planctomycetales bacterium]